MDDEIYAPLIDRTLLHRDPRDGRLRIRIPERANMALDTVGRYARGAQASRIALTFEESDGSVRRYDFAELDALSDRLAAGLAALGVGRGEPVAVHTGQRPETAIAHLAIYKLGAVAMTVSQLYGPDTVEHILGDSGARVILTRPSAWARLRDSRSRFPALEHCIVAGEARPGPGELTLDAILGAPGQRFEALATGPEDPALLMYTSGSTGLPKGLLHGHRIAHAYQPTLSLTYNLELDRPGGVFWTPADWAWVGGWLDTAIPAWQHGHQVVASEHRFDEEWAFDFMARHGVTHAFLTPTALKRLAQVEGPQERWALALRVVCTGGESLPGDVIRWVDEELGIVCNEFYGLTEFNHMVGNCKALFDIRPGSMGRAYPGRRVAIIDDTGQEVPHGTVGEVASWREDDPSLFLGYWGRLGVPEAMALGGWLRSGDLALRDSDGYFWYQGRNDDLIKSAGYRIGPAEVEDALVRHRSVAEAAVVGAPDPDRGSVVMAYVRLMPETEPSEALKRELQDHVKANLAAYKYPRIIEFVDDLPMTSSGKISRRELRSRIATRPG
jgi:acetyl-CoA synthetase